MFSFGGSKSKGRSESDSWSYQDSMSSSVSGGSSVSGSENLSGGVSRDRVAFEDVFSRLYGDVQNTIPSLDASSLTNAANQLFTGGTDFLSSLEGGSDYLQNRLSEDNPVLQAQIDQLGGDINEFLTEDVLPGIRGNAIAAGGFGGGRQGVAEGEAAESALEEFSRGVTALRAGDVSARDQIAAGLVGQQGQGLSALPGLAGIADMGAGAALMPYERMAAIMGGPMALTESSQFGRGSSFSSAEDFARAYSEAIGRSRSRSRSKTDSSSASIGFGSS